MIHSERLNTWVSCAIGWAVRNRQQASSYIDGYRVRYAFRTSARAARPQRTFACLLVTITAAIGWLGLATSQAAADEAPQAEFTGAVGYGISTAISADGSTAVIGQLGLTGAPGVVHVYTSGGANWAQQAELTASDPSYDTLFGNAVATSASGNTVIVGDPGECGYGLKNCEQGAAYVFTRSGSIWTQQAELRGGPGFGGAVALSSDGNTALVGAGLSGYYGRFHDPAGNAPPTLFSRSGTDWTQEATLSASDASGPFDDFGYAVALSADGSTVLIGDPTQDEDTGAAYVFTGSGANWTQQSELMSNDVSKGSEFGASVALSADGHTSLVGAPAPDGGSAYLFSNSGSNWIQQAELTPDDAEVTSFDGWFGASVALDGAGNVALVGAPWADEDFGVTYAFAGEGPSWTQQGEFILDNATPYDYFGDAVALNGEGTTALIGRYDPGADFFRMPAPHFPAPPVGSNPPGTTSGSGQTSTTSASGDSTTDSNGATPVPDRTATTPSHGPSAVPAKVDSETLSPTTFPAAVQGASALAATNRYGANVAYTLDAGDEVRFTIAEVQQGLQSSAGHCIKPARANSGARRCTRLVKLPGSFTLAGEAGVNHFRFTGRLAGHKLAVGTYQMTATPIADDGARHSATASFRIIE